MIKATHFLQGHVRISNENFKFKESSMKHNTAPTPLVIVLAGAILMSMAPTAQAEDSSCSLARAAGKYAFTDNGTVVGVGPRVAVGIFTLDAAGNFINGKVTSSLNGAIADETASGTYTVNSDCTGTFSLQARDLSGSLLLTITANVAWDDNMKALRAIFTSVTLPSGTPLLTVISAEGRKMVP